MLQIKGELICGYVKVFTAAVYITSVFEHNGWLFPLFFMRDTSSCWEINSSLLSDIDRKAIKEPRSVNEFLLETTNRLPIAIYASLCKMWRNLIWRDFFIYHCSSYYIISGEKLCHGSPCLLDLSYVYSKQQFIYSRFVWTYKTKTADWKPLFLLNVIAYKPNYCKEYKD